MHRVYQFAFASALAVLMLAGLCTSLMFLLDLPPPDRVIAVLAGISILLTIISLFLTVGRLDQAGFDPPKFVDLPKGVPLNVHHVMMIDGVRYAALSHTDADKDGLVTVFVARLGDEALQPGKTVLNSSAGPLHANHVT